MPTKGVAIVMHFYAGDTDGPVTGDSGNLTMSVVKDGPMSSLTTATVTEANSTYCPGIYSCSLDADENNADTVTLTGYSGTSGVVVTPTTWTNVPPLTAAAIADAIWDEATSGHTTSGTFGEQCKTDIASILAAGGASAASIADAVWDEATSGHTTGGTFGQQCKTDIDAILVDTGSTLPATTFTANVKQINGSSDSADQLALSCGQIIPAQVETSGFTPTTTKFVTDTAALSTNINHYLGRIIIFTSGNLAGQAQEITAYMDGADKKFTTSAWTEAPADTDNFVIV